MPAPDNYNYAAAITTSDTVNFVIRPQAIYVGGAGNIVAVWQDDTTTTFTAVPVGSTLLISPKRINATLTTATALLALRQV